MGLTGKSVASRLMFIDVLRGIGALAVFYQHVGERVSPVFADFTTYHFQLGQFGVMLFFLCSGFVIPASLERHNSLTKFWIRRIFRIYPLYWFSLFVALVLSAFSIYLLPTYFQTAPVISILANITMFQTFLGIPNAIPLYWSLAFEMGFYLLVSILFITGVSQKTYITTTLLLIGSLGIGLFFPLVLNRNAPIGLLFNFATMYVGTVFLRNYTGTLTLKQLKLILSLAMVTIVVTLAASFLGRDQIIYGGTQSFLPMLTAWIGAYLLFTVSFVAHRHYTHRVLIYLGKISYSIYLLHPLVMSLFPPLNSAILSTISWSFAVLLVSTITYRFIEEPLIKLGLRVEFISKLPVAVQSKENSGKS